MSLVDSIELIHQEVMEEEGIKMKDLPTDLQKKLKGWNLLFSRLKKNPEDEKLARSLQRQSVELADKIQNFIETDYEDGGDEGEEGSGKKSEKKEEGEGGKGSGKKPEKKEEGEGGEGSGKKPEKKEEGEGGEGSGKKPEKKSKAGFGNLVMEKKIKDKIKANGDGRISIRDLQAIIGKEPDYPEQKVHSIKLRKVFMASSYRLTN